jgi:hypothetical protein
MIRSIVFLSPFARLLLILPLAGACSSSDDDSDLGADPAASRNENRAGAMGEQRPTDGSPGSAANPATGASPSADVDERDDDQQAGADADDAAGMGSDMSPAAGSSGGGEDAEENTPSSSATGPEPVQLGSAGNYVILAKSAITNVPTSAVTGDVGISPAAASAITGFTLTRAGATFSAPEIVGGVFAADNDDPTPSDLASAVLDMQAAYDDAAGRVTPEFLELGDGAIGGLTLTPGLYKWTSVVSIPSDVTLSGDSDDVWIFQISGDLNLSSGTEMILQGGAQPSNIVWQVAGVVDLGTTSHAEGILLSKTAIVVKTGASINGRLLAQTAVTLDQASVTEPR